MKLQSEIGTGRSPRFHAIVECSTYLLILCLGVLAVLVGAVGVHGAAWITLILVSALFFLSWFRFEGGRHPYFLFIGLLIVFQCGRIIGYIFGLIPDPFVIDVQTPVPFDISQRSIEVTLLCIAASAIFVYLPCRWNYAPRTYRGGGPEGKLRTAAYLLFALTIPFIAYKNYAYLRFFQSHGGYFILYIDPDAVFQSVGSIVRVLSLFGAEAFMLLYILERRPRRLFVVTSVFLLLSVMELLTGFRGKVFIELLVLWYVYNLKTGKRFRLLPLASAGIVLSIAGVLIAGFREKRTAELVGPIGFLTVQGVSLNVTECAVAFRNVFRPHALSYLLHGLLESFVALTKLPPGTVFANDLSMFLSASSFELGGGTGSSYLAEAYIFGGLIAVIVASLAIGAVLSWVHNRSDSFIGVILLVSSLGSLIYLPRSGVVAPVSATIKALVPLCILLGAARLLYASAQLLSSPPGSPPGLSKVGARQDTRERPQTNEL